MTVAPLCESACTFTMYSPMEAYSPGIDELFSSERLRDVSPTTPNTRESSPGFHNMPIDSDEIMQTDDVEASLISSGDVSHGEQESEARIQNKSNILEMLHDASLDINYMQESPCAYPLPLAVAIQNYNSPLPMYNVQQQTASGAIEGYDSCSGPSDSPSRKSRHGRGHPYKRPVVSVPSVDVDAVFPKTTKEFFAAREAKRAQKVANRTKAANEPNTALDFAKMTGTERKHAQNTAKGIFVVQTRGKNKGAGGVSVQIVITKEKLVELQFLEIQAQADMLGISHSAVKTARKVLGIKQLNLRSVNMDNFPVDDESEHESEQESGETL